MVMENTACFVVRASDSIIHAMRYRASAHKGGMEARGADETTTCPVWKVARQNYQEGYLPTWQTRRVARALCAYLRVDLPMPPPPRHPHNLAEQRAPLPPKAPPPARTTAKAASAPQDFTRAPPPSEPRSAEGRGPSQGPTGSGTPSLSEPPARPPE